MEVSFVGFVNTPKLRKRHHATTKVGWWPDPLLPLVPFGVKAGEAQPIWVSVTTGADTPPGVYGGNITVKTGNASATVKLEVKVFNFTVPVKGHLGTMTFGCGNKGLKKHYGGDYSEELYRSFIDMALTRRLPPVGLVNGWGWKTAKAPKAAGGYDFSKLDPWLDLFAKRGATMFPLASVPRFTKYGGGSFNSGWYREFAGFAKAYHAYLEKKGMAEMTFVYNIDEASRSLGEWKVCREVARAVRAQNPKIPIMQCLNENNGVRVLSDSFDILDTYYPFYYKAGTPEQVKKGKRFILAVCCWPVERPNVFIDYPLIDARMLPWICRKVNAWGFEYWELFGWRKNIGVRDWYTPGNPRTAWKLHNRIGDGYLLYPARGPKPLSSLRFEALRDGFEDYEYLWQLAAKAENDPKAKALYAEAMSDEIVKDTIVYTSDAEKLHDLRNRIGEYLSSSAPRASGTTPAGAGRSPVGDARPKANGAAEKKAGRLLQMARTAERMGQKPLARQLYAQIIEKYPGTEAGATAARKLGK